MYFRETRTEGYLRDILMKKWFVLAKVQLIYNKKCEKSWISKIEKLWETLNVFDIRSAVWVQNHTDIK